jgi:hypothetical protein
MTTRPLSPARRTTLLGLIVTAAGIVILKVAGVAMPVVPPGLVLLVVAAVLVATVRGRWAVIVALLVALSEAIGFAASGSAAGLVSTGALAVLTGTWVRLVGTVVAVVAGAQALREPAAVSDRT